MLIMIIIVSITWFSAALIYAKLGWCSTSRTVQFDMYRPNRTVGHKLVYASKSNLRKSEQVFQLRFVTLLKKKVRASKTEDRFSKSCKPCFVLEVVSWCVVLCSFILFHSGWPVWSQFAATYITSDYIVQGHKRYNILSLRLRYGQCILNVFILYYFSGFSIWEQDGRISDRCCHGKPKRSWNKFISISSY